MQDRSLRHITRSFLLTGVLVWAAGCASPGGGPTSLPSWSFEPGMVFPADHSLDRPEDGVALPDGRLLVADRVHGLRLVAADGTSEPFGDLPGAGYVHEAPGRSGAANGVSLEPGGTHVLVADVLDGGIYRIAIADGETERIYRHAFGVNTACRDSSGAIWFTQSTQNTTEQGEAGVFGAIDVPIANGALYRLPMRDGGFAARAEVVCEGLYFPNGLVLDEPGGVLYMSELCADRVLRADLDVEAGRIGAFSTLVELPLPDNLEMDRDGRLWVAMPLSNEVGVVETTTGVYHSVFRAQTPAQARVVEEFVSLGRDAAPRIGLFTPEVWSPLPGAVTGLILNPDDGPIYLTGLGDALVRLPR